MTSNLLSELARAKVLFQLRAIEAIIHGPASVDRSPKGGNRETGCHRNDESAVGDSRDAQNTSEPHHD